MTKYLQMVKDNANNIAEVLDHFRAEYELAKGELKIQGNLQREIADLSVVYENRFEQLQELEAILEYFNIKLKGVKSALYQKMMNSSARALTSNDIKQYIDGDKTVIDVQMIINDIVYVRNCYLGLTKGFETKNFMISNIVKLQCAGLDSIVM